MTEQTNLFEMLYPSYKITKPIRLIELFAGVGSQAMALRDLGLSFEHHKVVEIDKYAIRSYNAIHGTEFEPMDITQLHACDLEISNKDKYEYLMTYSFPCQDLSKAGKQKGMSKGVGTRSGLLWEVERLLKELNETDSLPQVLLMENVPDVIGTKNIKDFNLWYAFLESIGYQSYYKVLNATYFGIPQNRERCFMVSILGDYNYEFPKGFELELRLKDMLEDEVDEKYYLSDEAMAKLDEKMIENIITSDISNTVRTSGRSSMDRHSWDLVAEPKIRQIGNIVTSQKRENPNRGRVYDAIGISPTLDCMKGGGRTPLIIQKGHGYNHGGAKEICPSITSSAFHENNYIVFDDYNSCVRKDQDTIGTITMNIGSPSPRNGMKIIEVEPKVRIRKLTPKECWRLMGFADDDFHKAEAVNSNSQLYKQAGNSIVKQVLIAIIKQMI